ncbi:MAG TPA: hypothetical protein DGZ24_04710 [Rhodospirillaceae bacterium]|nr:hypothetical protein [Rhodospirillaceae bacterium]
MIALTRENRDVKHQASLVFMAFRQNSLAGAIKLVWPVLMRRIKEVSRWVLGFTNFCSARRRLIREFFSHTLIRISEPTTSTIGNYAAYIDMLTPDSVVYSFGIGGDIRFDATLADVVACPIHLFDPTPRSAQFMTRHENQALLRFYPWGLWIENGPTRFFSDVTLMKSSTGTVVHEYRSGSITNLTGAEEWFEAECLTLQSIMKRLGHHHIDLLKMDIEGAALDVMESLLATTIRPKQIVVEFEAPHTLSDLKVFLTRLEVLMTSMIDNGYRLHVFDRGKIHIESIELLAVCM